MLPGSHGGWASNHDRLFAKKCPDNVGYQPVFCPVSTTDDITGSGTGYDRTNGFIRTGKVRLAIGCRYQFRAGLAAGVRIVSTQRLAFPISPNPLTVFITLVARHVQQRTNTLRLAHRFQDMHGTHDVGRVRFYRVAVRVAHQRLGSQVNDDIRPMLGDDGTKVTEIADVAFDRLHVFRHARQ